MIGSPYRRRFELSRRSCFMLTVEVIVLGFAIWRLSVALLPGGSSPASTISPTGSPPPTALRDTLPTPTPDTSIPPRLIAFPGASMSAPIIPAGRVEGTWETRHLGDSVGHLVGTSWIDGDGGNVVLAGHVENYAGAPGPFAHLFEAELGDMVILSDGVHEERYQVTKIERVDPYDVSWVAQDGEKRVTMITCTDWDWNEDTYMGRLIVIAEPMSLVAQ